MQLSLYIILELLALLFSLAFFRQLRVSFLRLFPLFLLLTVSVELGSQWIYYYFKLGTGWLYNIFIGVQMLFFLSLFFVENRNHKRKNIALTSGLIFLLFYIVNLLFLQGVTNFNYISYLVGCFLLMINACIFFLELISRSESEGFFKQQLFWVTSGILVFFTGSFFYFLFWYWLVIRNVDSNGHLFRVLLDILNIVFYCALIIGFICPAPSRK